LLARHWNISTSKEAFEVFECEAIELILPKNPAKSGSVRAIDDAIRTLSQFEDRPVANVISDIRAIGYDSVKSRLPDSAIRNDGVSLEVAAEFVQGAKDLLASSATSEIEPKPAFLRNRKDAIDYSNRCVFGHTFRGSFGFVIESPVSPNDAPSLLDVETPPFERRVIERLVRGLRDVDDAVRRQNLDALTVDHLNGFNANMCEDFATLVEKVSPSGLLIDVTFSPEWSPREGLLSKSIFTVDNRHAEAAEEAARTLRKIEIRLDRTVVGRVVRLESNANPQELLTPQGTREIAIDCSSEDLGQVRVRMALQPRDYLRALEAHRLALSVSVTGRLDRVGRNWWLVEHGELTIAGDRSKATIGDLGDE
jgi:hypothetical protein